MNRDKEVLQKWIEDLGCSHFITIEPTPYLPFKPDEIRQRLRTIEFKLNKRYLGNSFPKWKDEDKFYFIVFPEGDGVSNQKHYHALLHTPKKVVKKKFYYEDGVIRDLIGYWCILPSKNPTTHKVRNFEELMKIIRVEKVDSHTATSKYSSKKYNVWCERLGLVNEDLKFFFTTPTKSQKLQSMRVQ